MRRQAHGCSWGSCMLSQAEAFLSPVDEVLLGDVADGPGDGVGAAAAAGGGRFAAEVQGEVCGGRGGDKMSKGV